MDNSSPEPEDRSGVPVEAPAPGVNRYAVRIQPRKAIATTAILAVTVLVYLAQMYSQSTMNGLDYPFLLGGKINALINQGQIWRLITPVFLHGSIFHIGFNMYALWVLGRPLERYYGHGRFLLLYFLGGLAGNVLSYLFSPNPSLGASTAIFGLAVAQGVFVYQNRRFFGEQVRPLITNVLFVVGLNLFLGLTPGSNIDNFGHLGGLAGGLLFSWLAGPVWDVTGVPPNLSMTDTRPSWQVALAVVLVVLLFGGLAASRILR